MGRVAVVADSSACLPPSLGAELDVYTAPLRFFIDGTSYRDGVDITATELYRMLPQVRELPTTSAPTPSDFCAALEGASTTHESAVVITLARRFSGMHQSATVAAATARESLSGFRVTVIDSGTAAGAEGLVVLNAARTAMEGADHEEVCSAARETMARVHLVATLKTLYFLARGGRVPMAAHWANSVVHVNPIFRILPLSGEARTARVARGRESAIRQMLELVEEGTRAGSLHAVVFHSDCLDEAERLRDRVATMFRCDELYLSDFTPAMGIHAGPGVLGIAYYCSG